MKHAKPTTLTYILQLHAQKKLVGAFRLSNADYHASPGISKSATDDLAVSPLFYKWKLQNPMQFTPALIFGSAYHCLLLEPEDFESLFYVTDTQPRVSKPDAQSRMPLSKENLEKINDMLAVYRANEIAVMLVDGVREMSFFWTDPETGIQCKCKPDVILASGIVVDNKTTADCGREEFQKSMMNYRYYVQAAFTLQGIQLSQSQSGQDFGFKIPDSFVFVAQEKSEPYDIGIYQIGPHSLSKGDQHVARDLQTYARCVTDGVWPGVTTGISELELPTFFIARD